MSGWVGLEGNTFQIKRMRRGRLDQRQNGRRGAIHCARLGSRCLPLGAMNCAHTPVFSTRFSSLCLFEMYWALRVARGWGWDRVHPRGEPREQDAGDHEGPPTHPSSTLAPTAFDGLVLSLMHSG